MRWPFRAPAGDRAINAVIFIGIGIWFLLERVYGGGKWVSSLFGTTTLLLGIGLWFWYSRVRWPAAGLMVLIALFNLYNRLRGTFSWISFLANLGCLWFAWCVFRDGAEAKEEEQPPDEEERP